MAEEITAQQIEDIFLQGDVRYDNHFSEKLAKFFNHQGLILEKEEIKKFEISDEEVKQMPGPQQCQKATAHRLLLSKGFEFVGYERNIGWGIVDVFAEKEGNLLAIECGPCRLTKVVDYFRMPYVEELWVVSMHYKEKMLYKVKKGPNWNEFLCKLDEEKGKWMKTIKSPLDSL